LQGRQWKEFLAGLKALSSSEIRPCFALSWNVDKESRKVSSLWLWGDYFQEYLVNNWTKPNRNTLNLVRFNTRLSPPAKVEKVDKVNVKYRKGL